MPCPCVCTAFCVYDLPPPLPPPPNLSPPLPSRPPPPTPLTPPPLPPPPYPRGRAVPVSRAGPSGTRACPDVVLSVGALPSLRGNHPTGGPGPAHDQPGTDPSSQLGDGPLLAFPAGTAPPGLLAALRAFVPVEEAPPGDLPGEGKGPKPQADHLDVGLELDADKDNEPPPPPAPRPPPPRGPDLAPGGGGGGSARGRAPLPAQGWDLRCCAQPRGNPAAQDPQGSATPAGHDLAPPGGSAALHATLHSPWTGMPRPDPRG